MNNALMKKMVLWCVIPLLASGVNAHRTLYVSPTGTNNAAEYYPDWAGAAQNIQDAVDLAGIGDTVLVTNHVNHYLVTTNIVVTNGITLRSWNNGALDPTNTIVSGGGNVRCLYLNHTNALVAGFTFTNGNGIGDMDNNGGGVRMGGAWNSWTAGGTLSNCIVVGNTAANGGGVLAYGSASLVTHCRITDNTAAESGGGAYIYAGIIRDSTLEGNKANSSMNAKYVGGGGLYLRSDSRAGDDVLCMADTCRIINNQAIASGGGVWMGSGLASIATDISLLNSTVSNNTQVGDNDLYGGGGVYLHQTVNAKIQDCTIASNSGWFGGGIVFHKEQASEQHGGYVSNCIVRNNLARKRFGGITDSHKDQGFVSNIKIFDTIIEGNTENIDADARTGGVSLRRGAIIERCIIRNNLGRQYGGLHIANIGVGTSIVRNCLIAGNTNVSIWGAAGITIGSNTYVQSCTVASNIALYDTDGKGGLHFAQDGGSVSNSIVMFNTGATADNWSVAGGVTPRIAYSCTYPTNGLTGAGNIEMDPLFADDEFRLSRGSPCINAGMNQDWMFEPGVIDLDGRPRIDRFSGVVDMGCYEYLPRGTLYQLR